MYINNFIYFHAHCFLCRQSFSLSLSPLFRHLLPLYTYSQLQQHAQASKQTLSLALSYTFRNILKTHIPAPPYFFTIFLSKMKRKKKEKKNDRVQ